MDWEAFDLGRDEAIARFNAWLDGRYPVRRWQIELPFRKPANLNARQHHMVRAKVVAAHREATADVVRLMEVPPMDRIRTGLIYSPRSNGRRDPINLVPTLKVLEDAVVDCGIVPDDNPAFVTSTMPIVLPKLLGDEKFGTLWLVIEEA